jgi:hypothetical protein
VWVHGVDKSFQQKQGAPEDIEKQTEEPPQPVDDCQAEEIAGRKAEVESVRRKVEDAIRNATYSGRRRWEAEVQKHVDAEARAAKFEAQAEDAKCRAEAAEREAEAARVVVLEVTSGLEKAAAGEVVRAACNTASNARYEADCARIEAARAAREARSWE